MRKTVLISALALVSGLVVGYLIGVSHVAAPARADVPASSKPVPAAAASPSRHPEKRGAELKSRLAGFRRHLPATDAAAGTGTPVRAGKEEKKPPEAPHPTTFLQFLTNLRTNDPPRYAELTNNFERMRMEHEKRAAERIDFFRSIDTSQMAPEARADHENLLALFEQNRELDAELQSGTLSEAEIAELMGRRGRNWEPLHEGTGRERAILLRQMAAALGYEDADAQQEVVDTVQAILDNTDMFNDPMPPPIPKIEE